MQIADNGAGFRPELLSEKEKGLGLQTMKERTEMLGGHFIINSSPETGTRITVEVRLP
jgi:signal transduction histidine kinase